MDSPALFVRRTLRGGLAMACAACAALLAAGLPAWAGGVAVGAAVALANFWLLGRAVLRLGAGPGGGSPGDGAAGGGGARPLRAALRGTALRLLLAGLALGAAILFLPVHPVGLAAGLVGVHAVMAVLWVARSLAGIES